ncbi:hypothetical protein JCM39068_26950 [Desulfocastanea catecholica]
MIGRHGPAAGKTLQQGQDKAGGLAGAGFRRGHDISAGKHRRQRLDLNRKRSSIALFTKNTKERFGEAKMRK